jgi:hypothetical protein
VSIVRRTLMALGPMAATAAAFRLNGNGTSPRVVGGWRALTGPSYR